MTGRWLRRRLAALAVTGVFLTTWYIVGEGDCSVEGGYILNLSDDSVTVRCLSPDVTLQLDGFEGRVEFTNCFPDAQVEGFDGDIARNGTRMSLSVSDDSEDLRLTVPEKASFKFAVLGDSQGKNDILAQILDSLDGCDFVIHCGDLTPSGADSEFEAVEETLNSSGVPVFTTPGNHDARLGDLGAYVSRFGPADYGFTMENYGHGGRTSPEGEGMGVFTIYDWGNGAAAEATMRIRDHYGALANLIR